MPEVELTEEEMAEPYGIPEPELPSHVRSVMNNYMRWCTADINLSRSAAYTNAVQSTTVDKNRSTIRGYLGFCALRLDVPVQNLRLSLYADADKFIAFLGYLRARAVGKAQLTKQVRREPEPHHLMCAVFSLWLARTMYMVRQVCVFKAPLQV